MYPETWGMDEHGGPHYHGHCPICGTSTGCHDAPCEDCEEIKCQDCGEYVSNKDFNHSHGCCNSCLDYRAEQFTEKFKSKIQNL